MKRLFEDALSDADRQEGRLTNVVQALFNVSETDAEPRVTAELPGVTEKDVDLSPHDDVLTIRAEKRFE